MSYPVPEMYAKHPVLFLPLSKQFQISSNIYLFSYHIMNLHYVKLRDMDSHVEVNQ